MPSDKSAIVIRKYITEERCSNDAGDVLSNQHAKTWHFTPVGSQFHRKSDTAIIGDLWITTVYTETGYVLSRVGATSGCFGIHIVEEGRCDVTTDTKTVEVVEGHAHLWRSDRVWRTVVEADTTLTVIAAPIRKYSRFASLYKGDLRQQFSMLEPLVSTSEISVSAVFDIARLLQALGKEATPYQDIPLTASILKEALLQSLIEEWPRNSSKVINKHNLMSRHVRKATSWIEFNIREKITLQDIALASGVSKRTLQNLFVEQLGVSPIQYVIQTRLRQIHGELTNPDNIQPLMIIAGRFGYFNRSELDKHYQKIYGKTPAETRRLVQLHTIK